MKSTKGIANRNDNNILKINGSVDQWLAKDLMMTEKNVKAIKRFKIKQRKQEEELRKTL